MSYNTLEELVVAASEGVRPPERLNVWQAAEKYVRINNPGSYVGPYDADITPYMKEPAEVLTSRLYTGCIFAAPAQCGKTQLFNSWVSYSVVCDPADMMLVQTAQATARDFSIRRVGEGRGSLFRNSPEVKKRVFNHRNADNTFDKRFNSGMILNFSWPSINELSGRPVPRLFLTDYDRMDQNIDGEGAPFALAQARATTFKQNGMTVAESSPGFEHMDTQWAPTSLHEAPPTEGILALYNQGDRRRWYWKCVSCEMSFMPSWNLITYPSSEDIMDAAEQAVMNCPHCGQVYQHHDTEVPGKHAMNMLHEDGGQSKWVKDGQIWTPDNRIVGQPVRSKTASFWLEGVNAAFNDWTELVSSYLAAKQSYDSTGKEETLKAVTNTKLGLAYTPQAQATARHAETLKGRAKAIGHKQVPYGARYLVATVDVQKNGFIVQVHGHGSDGDVYIVDRFEIKYSRRPQEDRPDQLHYVNAGSHSEDWRILLDEVMLKSYPLADNSGREMPIKMTFCDSGGRAGVTKNAYEFYRWLVRGYGEQADADEQATYPYVPGMAARFQLVKGDPNVASPRIRINYPDAQRKDRNAGARGEIPVMMINVNAVKNSVDKMLDRTDPGGRVNFPDWLPLNFYKELTVEIKDKKGKWENPNRYRNESWDLLVYDQAGILHKEINAERISWDNPPGWAAPWDDNDLVFYTEGGDKPFEKEKKPDNSLADLAALLG